MDKRTWVCLYCGSLRPADELKCTVCGGPRKLTEEAKVPEYIHAGALRWLEKVARDRWPTWEWSGIDSTGYLLAFFLDCVFIKARRWMLDGKPASPDEVRRARAQLLDGATGPTLEKHGGMVQVSEELLVALARGEDRERALDGARAILRQLVEDNTYVIPEGAAYPVFIPETA